MLYLDQSFSVCACGGDVGGWKGRGGGWEGRGVLKIRVLVCVCVCMWGDGKKGGGASGVWGGMGWGGEVL